MEFVIVEAAIAYAVICVVLASSIAWSKGRSPMLGIGWGLVLGIIGVLIVASMSSATPRASSSK